MGDVSEAQTSELQACALWLARARAGLLPCTREAYRATYRRYVALRVAWQAAGWDPGELPDETGALDLETADEPLLPEAA